MGTNPRTMILGALPILLSVVLGMGVVAISAPGAEAAVNCTNKSNDWTIERKYTDAYGRVVPVRCGHWIDGSGWGVVKLKAKGRWSIWYQGMIGATLEHPAKRWAQDSNTDIYVTAWQTNCNPEYRFRVIVNVSKKKGGSKYMKGVVNAYQEFR